MTWSNSLHKITLASVEPGFEEEGGEQGWRQGDRKVAMNWEGLVARGEIQAIKLCLVANRTERTEQIKRNVGDETDMNW